VKSTAPAAAELGVVRRLRAFIVRTKPATILSLLLLLFAAAVALTQAWQITTVLIEAYRGALTCILPTWFLDRASSTVIAFYPAFVARRFLQQQPVWPVFPAAGSVVVGCFIAVFIHRIQWYALAVIAVHVIALVWLLARDVIHLKHSTQSRANVA